ncbi:MAG: phosphatidylglycerophosphatase A [Desulfobacterales bacterium CG07_land_8_20_14_0_80_52_14]|nr:MAG: phosphohistidine phosphatase [Desulfobacterales bacterium CG23_combo_of_CG06-09_8_20_14_all_52_9]PIU49287.1 MAG: phosphatidylglycerophosphatase A [Desulfobacterales bacterium CG07_land_8_20_14_0_80_52_14]
MHFVDKAALFLATGCYVGKIPFAPGTFGSAVGLPIAYLVSLTPLPFSLLFIIAFIGFAVLISNRAEIVMAKKDPGDIVIDEIVGIVITFINFAVNVWILIAGFILFRIIDIMKPYPIRWIDRQVPGGCGVVLDDVIAGIYANLILRLITLWVV